MKLGQKVKDLVTGFEGTVVYLAYYLHGCVRVRVQPPMGADGKIPDSYTIDEPQLIVTNTKQVVKAKIAKQNVKLGQQVLDPVSGFTGVAAGRVVYLNGCSRIAVAPSVNKDGEMVDEHWFDEPQLEVLSTKKVVKEGSKSTGGPAPYTPNRGI